MGWRGGALRKLQLHAAKPGEVCMDAAAQALATRGERLCFEGGAEDRAGFLLHGSSMACGLNAQLLLGVLVEVADRERGQGRLPLGLTIMLSVRKQ